MKRRCLIELMLAVGIACGAPASGAGQELKKKVITVADTIQMTTIPDTQYAAEDTSSGRIALFSPDNRRVVIVTERGLLETNEREFSILMFQTDELFSAARPSVLVSMRSRSNRDGIRNVRWLDNSNLVFLGDAPRASQVYVFQVDKKRLRQVTNHPTPIIDYDFNRKAETVVYAAEPKPLSVEGAYQRCARGYAITNQALDDIPRSLEDCRQPSLLEGAEVYIKRKKRSAVRIPSLDYYLSLKPISTSPLGDYAIYSVLLRKVPPGWKDYADPFIRKEASAFRDRGPFSWIPQYVLVNSRERAGTASRCWPH